MQLRQRCSDQRLPAPRRLVLKNPSPVFAPRSQIRSQITRRTRSNNWRRQKLTESSRDLEKSLFSAVSPGILWRTSLSSALWRPEMAWKLATAIFVRLAPWRKTACAQLVVVVSARRRCGDGVATAWRQQGNSTATTWRSSGNNTATQRQLLLLVLPLLLPLLLLLLPRLPRTRRPGRKFALRRG